VISLDPADHEIRQEKPTHPLSRFTPSKVPQTFDFEASASKFHCVNPFGLHMDHPDFWVDYPEGDRHQYNSIENLNLSNALLYAAHYRTLDPGLGRPGLSGSRRVDAN